MERFLCSYYIKRWTKLIFLITPGHVVIFSSAALSFSIVIFQVNDEDESSDDGMLCKIYSVIPCFYIKSVYGTRNLGSIPCSLVMAGIPCCMYNTGLYAVLYCTKAHLKM